MVSGKEEVGERGILETTAEGKGHSTPNPTVSIQGQFQRLRVSGEMAKRQAAKYREMREAKRLNNES